MSEENQDAKTVESSGESSAPEVVAQSEAQAPEGKASAETNSAPIKSEEDNTPFHKHPRFQELVSEKNQLREQLSRMESLLQEKFESPKTTAADVARQKLVGLGVDEKAANELLDAIRLVSSGYTDDKLSNIESGMAQQEINSWLKELSETHKDYKTYEDEFMQTFASLPKNAQIAAVADKRGLEMLYSHVKQQHMEDELSKAYQRGVQDGYKNKQSKSSVSPGISGSANPPGQLTRKDLMSMPNDKYVELRNKIGIKALADMLLQAEGEQAGVL